MAATGAADALMKKGDKAATPGLFKFKSDWVGAGAAYEQAALKYRLAKAHAQAAHAYEKAADAQEKQGAPYHAAKHLESAAKSAKDAGGDGAAARVQDLAAQAATLYCEAGRATTAAEALGRHASAADALGDTDGAVGMLRRAFEFFEEEAEHYAADTYRAAVNMVLRRKRWADACEFLLKWGASSGRSKAVTTQCRCYLSALVVQLHAGDYDEAERCFNDCCAVPAFSRSDACEAGDRLLMAYRSADSEQIKDAVKGNAAFVHLESAVLRLAKGLPGPGVDLKAMVGAKVSAFADMKDMGEALDEDDLC